MKFCVSHHRLRGQERATQAAVVAKEIELKSTNSTNSGPIPEGIVKETLFKAKMISELPSPLHPQLLLRFKMPLE